MSYKVFFSHNASDGSWAKWIAGQAQLVGIEVYLYEHDPQPGVSIAAKVQQQIRDADALVVLLTPKGQASPYVQQEIGYAEAARRLIMPIVWPGVEARSLAMLQGREYLPFDPRNPTASLPALLKALQNQKAKKESGQALLALTALFIGAAALFGKK